MEEEEEEERREKATKAVAALQPNFKSQSITQDQLNKFKELHKRRLEIKARSKIQKSSKGNASGAAKGHRKNFSIKKVDECCGVELEDSKPSTTEEICMELSFPQQDIPATSVETKKRQKLHWGLDTKERWERKSNM